MGRWEKKIIYKIIKREEEKKWGGVDTRRNSRASYTLLSLLQISGKTVNCSKQDKKKKKKKKKKSNKDPIKFPENSPLVYVFKKQYFQL